MGSLRRSFTWGIVAGLSVLFILVVYSKRMQKKQTGFRSSVRRASIRMNALPFITSNPVLSFQKPRRMRNSVEILPAFAEIEDFSLDALELPEFSEFVVADRSSPPTGAELTNENILRIIELKSTDQETNELVWRCLGYRFDRESSSWKNEEVFAKWRERYPEPPDLIGVRRIYTKEVDGPSLKANQALVKTIPMDYKNGIRQHLFGMNGFFGLKMEGLTPNKTRRAQCANWLLFYREAMFGKSMEQLQKEKEQRQSSAASKANSLPDLDVSGKENLEARRAGKSARIAKAPNENQQ